LITAKKATPNLCRTLLSAAVLNYPPATLINYESSDDDDRPSGADIVRKTYDFLSGKETQHDDLILVAEEGITTQNSVERCKSNRILDSWFQLPAEVTINRFFHSMQNADKQLLEKHGRKPPEIELNSTVIPLGSPRYTQRVLFGAQKECSNPPEDLACYSAPEPPLPEDTNDFEADRNSEVKYSSPRYMGPTMAIGHVADLRPIYERATEILQSENNGARSSQYVFSQIWGKQEYVRSLRSKAFSINVPLSAWARFKLGLGDDPVQIPAITPTNTVVQPGKKYEFGIGLDYEGSIFQNLHNSADDIRFVTFKNPSTTDPQTTLSEPALQSPIQIPLDLNQTAPPFAQHPVSSPNPDPPIIAGLDDLPRENNGWQDIELATNIVAPSSSVPSTLNFHGNEALVNEWWNKMWYQPHARALLRQNIRNPDGAIVAKAAAEVDEWWDTRGGKGGAWTDSGKWLGWNEVCGGFEEQVFGDGRGMFGQEGVDQHGEGVVQIDKEKEKVEGQEEQTNGTKG
jgi:hypothetical protein